MHKRFVNHCTIELSLIPQGPVLIKSGSEGADPTKPSMEFVETYHQGGKSIYFPGSSLKGAIRAHAERIVRTVGGSTRPDRDKVLWAAADTESWTNNHRELWASNPLDDKDKDNNPNQYLTAWKNKQKDLDQKHPYPGAALYKQSCFTTQLFGSTSVASRFRIEDAYPTDLAQVKIEERNGVAIDRVFGSTVPGALFNYQVCTAGEFHTKIHLKNFTLAQLGLLGLVLRDLNDGWFGLGFAKSRGMGMVEVKLNKATVAYPSCELREEDQICLLGNRPLEFSSNMLLGVGEFLTSEERLRYGFFPEDRQATNQPELVPVTGAQMAYGVGVSLTWPKGQVEDLFTLAVAAWRQQLGAVAV